MDGHARRGDGAFQWSRAGWFGSQLGATAWLLVVGSAALAHSRELGLPLLALALLPNLIGIALWRRRRTLAPYPAIQILIAVCGVAALVSLIVVYRSGMQPASLGLPPAWLLALYPALMLIFHARERAVRKAAA